MEQFGVWVDQINSWVWGYVMMFLLLGTGIYLTAGLKFLSLRKLGYAFRQLFKGRRGEGEGDISPFNALMTSLSATIGTGNIAGVATAIGVGGPGALFWMWLTGLVGMATKFAEAVLAVRYREVEADGRHLGGPMYYIRNGLGKHWGWLAVMFAIFCGFGGTGTGNMIQANSIAKAVESTFDINPVITATVLVLLVSMVIIGGVKRIAHVAGALVPFMAVTYVAAGLIILVMHAPEIPAAIVLVFESAFAPTAAAGGFAGAATKIAVQYGVERGLLSNEAGQGSAPIAHAAAKTDDPVRQGIIAMLGTFIDTLVVCTITGLVLIVSGVWTSGTEGAVMTSLAFSNNLPGGAYILTCGLLLFAFTTMLGWAYYSERCVEYLFGPKSIIWFQLYWVAVIPLGALMELSTVWKLTGVFNGLMAFPNLIALLLLSPLIFKLASEYFTKDGLASPKP
ncbi:sodium:alanine symporter family protein [Porticoccus sp. W117]|uniref:alanine/glycine:cation symporter family protein n=1 Tax=Porticoccus sp. W117 TaxID=3054777 RepID=UPI00259572F9|nr:sodium:alanine symporter family protein [Porticoccus sp. W117]MDM3871965.1 sodium:alanine symporter family protein [Porticoccus sp. W117]